MNESSVVVGVEHTDSAWNAAEWAADIAAAWRAPVDLVHVHPEIGPPVDAQPCWLGLLQVAVWRAGASPGATTVVPGEPVERLTSAAAGARLLVVGGAGAAPGRPAGPVVLGVLDRASCRSPWCAVRRPRWLRGAAARSSSAPTDPRRPARR